MTDLVPPRPSRKRQADTDLIDTVGLRAAGPVPTGPAPRIATDWLHATHPDTGLAVVFKAGEALPEWAPTDN